MLLDVQIPGMNGLELQASLNELGIRLPVIVMTGQGDVATAVLSRQSVYWNLACDDGDLRPLLTTIACR